MDWMTPEKSKPKPPPVVESWWDAGREDRDLDVYFNWKFYCDAEDRSLDFAIELMTKRRKAAEAAAPKSPRKPRRRKA